VIKPYKFIFSTESLAAPVRLDTGLCAVVPAWVKLNQRSVDLGILQEAPLVDHGSTPRLALICHAYNASPALLKHIASTIDICRPSAVIFTTDSTEKEAILLDFLDQLQFAPPITKINILPNIGRDVIPFWHSIKEISAYSDVFLKLHWKESPHLDKFHPQKDGRKASEAWNNDIFNTLLPSSRGELDEILSLFTQDICCIYPRPWPPVSDIHWHSMGNFKHFSQLLRDLSLPASLSILPLVYPLGNMFYGSVSFFTKYADFFLDSLTPPPEPIGDDGTVLHANERIYTFLSASQGLDVAAIYPERSIGNSAAIDESLSSIRKIIIFPVSSLVDSSRSPLPELHFSMVADSMLSLLSDHNSRIHLPRKPAIFLTLPLARSFFSIIRRLIRGLVARLPE
jgi:hypothetical protein